jgi:hypothetical protein
MDSDSLSSCVRRCSARLYNSEKNCHRQSDSFSQGISYCRAKERAAVTSGRSNRCGGYLTFS